MWGLVALCVVSIVTILMVAMGANSRMAAISDVIVEASQLEVSLLNLRRNEKDFQLRLNEKYKVKFESNSLSFKRQLQVLIKDMSELSIDAPVLEALSISIDSYHTQFMSYAIAAEKLGLDNESGMYRLFYYNITTLSNTDKSEIIRLLRSAELFIATNTPSYLKAYTELYNKTKGEKTDENYAVKQLNNTFNEIVKQKELIGLKYNSGLRGHVRSNAHNVEALFSKVRILLDTVEKEERLLVWEVLLSLLFLIVAVFIFIEFKMINNIITPLENLSRVFNELGEEGGDLQYRLNVIGQDELSKISVGFNNFIGKIHHSVTEVAASGVELLEASKSIEEQSKLTFTNSSLQRDNVTQTVAAIYEMGATVNEIANNASQAADAANEAESKAKDGQLVILQTTALIETLSLDIKHASDVVSTLSDNTRRIEGVLDIIRDVADQTNLLALNAAIEAARAGEQGRGFAVVADEVRLLASRTSNSTSEIQEMIVSLQAEAEKAVLTIHRSLELTDEVVVSTASTSIAFASISDNVILISDMNTQMATATEEQSTVVNELNVNMEVVQDGTLKSSETAVELTDSSERLDELSQRLAKIVQDFKFLIGLSG